MPSRRYHHKVQSYIGSAWVSSHECAYEYEYQKYGIHIDVQTHTLKHETLQLDDYGVLMASSFANDYSMRIDPCDTTSTR
jgi:hypothetical protein